MGARCAALTVTYTVNFGRLISPVGTSSGRLMLRASRSKVSAITLTVKSEPQAAASDGKFRP